MQGFNMLINNYNYNYPLMNNYYYQQQLFQLNMMSNINYTNVNFFNQAQGNFAHQNNFLTNYQKSFYNKPNIFYKKQNNKISNIKTGRKIMSVKKEEKEDHKFDKINNSNLKNRRRSSISTDTTTKCDSSFNNSILSEDEKELEKNIKKEKKDKKKKFWNQKVKNNSNYKKKLSNITEASESSKNSNDNDNENANNSESDNDDLENSFFSDTETDDKEVDKNENGKKFDKKIKNGKFGKKEAQGNKFENEQIFFENEEYSKKIVNENNISNIKKEYMGNPSLENIEVLRVNVKLEEGKNAVFKLKRYDDVFETIKLFCEINSVDEKLIKPLIIKSLSTLNTIYQIMNSKVNDEQIEIMKKIKKDII